jgi:hypothetical protein
MGDLIAFDGYVNASTPFNWHEYDYIWKGDRRYHDFQPGNAKNQSCQYPRIWGQDGFPLTQDILDQMDGCRESEFDLVSQKANLITDQTQAYNLLVWRHQRNRSLSQLHQLNVQICLRARSTTRVAPRRSGQDQDYVLHTDCDVRH